MILCPNCMYKNLVGALFCSECGTQLVFREGKPTSTFTSSPLSAQETSGEYRVESPILASDESISMSGISLDLMKSGELIHLINREEVTLGRVSEGQPVIPDIDLTPFEAFETGVSRVHASLDFRNNQVAITDLGSSNGTRINGRKIVAQTPYQLKHMDILTLGKLKIRVIFRKPNGG